MYLVQWYKKSKKKGKKKGTKRLGLEASGTGHAFGGHAPEACPKTLKTGGQGGHGHNTQNKGVYGISYSRRFENYTLKSVLPAFN